MTRTFAAYLAAALASFRGVERRLQRVGNTDIWRFGHSRNRRS